MIRFEIGPEYAGQRLDRALSALLPEASRAQLQKHIQLGAVLINEAPPSRGAKTKLQAGMVVTYEEPPPQPMDLKPEPIPLDIIHEDDHLLVINKPAHLVVHPGDGNPDGTLLNGVLHHLGQLPDTDPVRPGIVHRLDRGTSGVMVVSKTVEMHANMAAKFRDREVKKTYLALTTGVPEPSEGTFETFYGRHPTQRKKFTSKIHEGKKAITHFEVLEAYPGVAAIQVGLETGRTHQIRVHFADYGYALIADDTYGGRHRVRDPEAKKIIAHLDRPALHAWELRFRHPITNKKMRFTAPLPEDLSTAIEALRELSEKRLKER